MRIELAGWCGRSPNYRIIHENGNAFHAQGYKCASDYVKKAMEIGEKVQINHNKLKEFLQQNQK